MEWQPIETAPKEEDVLVWFKGGWIAILVLTDCYGPTVQNPKNPSGDVERRQLGIAANYEWRNHSGDGDQDYRPTYWMPLPPPPLTG